MKNTKFTRKDRIIDSAKQLILEGGVQKVTIKNIAKKNNITEGAIYRHFNCKKDILLGVVDMFGRGLLKVVDDVAKSNKDPVSMLREIMKTQMTFSEKKKEMLFAITAESIHFDDDEIRLTILGIIQKYKKKIEELLKKAKKNKLIRKNVDVGAVSFIFFGMFQSAIVQYALTNYHSVPVGKFDTMWKVFVKGIE